MAANLRITATILEAIRPSSPRGRLRVVGRRDEASGALVTDLDANPYGTLSTWTSSALRQAAADRGRSAAAVARSFDVAGPTSLKCAASR